MERYGSSPYHNAIGCVYEALPAPLVERLRGVDFLCGIDPVFAGLHPGPDVTFGGRSYRDTGACYYPLSQEHLPRDRRVTTIALPTVRSAHPWIVLHELGHVLHMQCKWFGPVTPVTEYAKSDPYEAFAEAFCAWRAPFYAGCDLRAVDPRVDALFESLAAP